MNSNDKSYRANGQIKFSPLIVIDQDGRNLGSTTLMRARELASEAGLDLVEISPNSRPPVCRIMDFGKFKFEQALKEKKQRKKQQKQSHLKEVRLSPSIAENDLETKFKSAVKFLQAGQRVNLKMEFRRREIAHKDIGLVALNNFIERLKDYGSASGKPKSEGRSISCLLDPKDEKSDANL